MVGEHFVLKSPIFQEAFRIHQKALRGGNERLGIPCCLEVSESAELPEITERILRSLGDDICEPPWLQNWHPPARAPRWHASSWLLGCLSGGLLSRETSVGSGLWVLGLSGLRLRGQLDCGFRVANSL